MPGVKTAKKAPAKKKAAPKAMSPWQAWSAKPEDASAELMAAICGGSHLAEFCRVKGLAYQTVRDWIDADKGRSGMYARAREDRADKIADEIVAISDEIDVKAATDEHGEVRLSLDAAAVARNRLRVDARKWVASKLKPRVYGDKLDVTQELTVKNLSDEQLQAEIERLSAKINAAGGT